MGTKELGSAALTVDEVVPLFSPSRYFTLYIPMCVIFGAVFMYALVVVSLELVGAVPSATWRRWRQPAIVTIWLVATVITPSRDPFSFTAMAISMLIFYEASILIGGSSTSSSGADRPPPRRGAARRPSHLSANEVR